MIGGNGVRRRDFLVLSTSTLLVGCASQDAPARTTQVPTATATAASSDAATTTGAATTTTEPTTGSPTASPTGQAVPSRLEIQQRFGDTTPTSFGLEVPGIVQRHGRRGVALTFDLCGGPGGEGFDRRLLDLLHQHDVPATFFLNARWTSANGALARELGSDPLLEIANHGYEHRPLTVDGHAAYGIRGTADAGAAYDEVVEPVAGLTEVSGSPPRWFRSGTAHCDDVGVAIAEAVGQRVVNFSINGDGGATFSGDQVAGEIGRAGDGDIVIAHANQPGSGTAPGLASALPVMLDRGAQFVRLSDVL